MKILLTGITGFLGSHLARALIKDDHEIIALKRRTSDVSIISNIIDKVSLYNVEDFFSDTFEEGHDVDIVIHAATNYGKNDSTLSDIIDANVLFPLKIMEHACSKNAYAFINTDSFFSKEGNECSYLSEYVSSKKIFYELGALYTQKNNCTFVNMQLEHIFGDGDGNEKFITNILNLMREDATEIKLTPGEQKRDFIYISDVENAYLAVINSTETIRSKKIKNFEVGRGIAVSVKDFIELAYKIIGSKSKLLFGNLEYRENEIMCSKANINTLLTLGWKSSVSIEEGIKRVVASLRK